MGYDCVHWLFHMRNIQNSDYVIDINQKHIITMMTFIVLEHAFSMMQMVIKHMLFKLFIMHPTIALVSKMIKKKNCPLCYVFMYCTFRMTRTPD